MEREKVLITVKTYPTLSRKHGELVCTAGVREDGSWVRLYPIPFRLLDYNRIGDAFGLAVPGGFRYTRSSFRCTSSKAVETFSNDSEWPSRR